MELNVNDLSHEIPTEHILGPHHDRIVPLPSRMFPKASVDPLFFRWLVYCGGSSTIPSIGSPRECERGSDMHRSTRLNEMAPAP